MVSPTRPKLAWFLTPKNSQAIIASKKLEREDELNDITFIYINPNEDLPFEDEKQVVILDTVQGIDNVELIGDEMLDKLIVSPRGSVHDFDLAFQLKYLKKLGKLGKVYIVGLPQGKNIDYLRIKSILRKLVAQDIQGS